MARSAAQARCNPVACASRHRQAEVDNLTAQLAAHLKWLQGESRRGLKGLNRGIINTAEESTSFRTGPERDARTLAGATTFNATPAMSAA